ncbi:hypothetical protein GCK72_011606 [Caenorhabditis remanei]|uniref:Uncharacterized protein n=1 Tax=Caenorhabditis remanei TaxID=31234 RepID=A0A6A5H684_CAERE|nr:hypothetical protein GCK72_011606 [Caenorhabditis remanei]KAF1763340.1 hypothetical protein GCK72_011606 [Caenorhabditis remanei]
MPSPDKPRQCASCLICGNSTIEFNYGVVCCNACKMFYRRAIKSKSRECAGCNSRKCRYCRFQRCVSAGMQIPCRNGINPVRSQSLPENSCLDNLLAILLRLNHDREDKLSNGYHHHTENLSIHEVIGRPEPITFVPRPKYIKMNVVEWELMIALTSVDYLKKVEFMNLLGSEDRSILLKNRYPSFSLFAIAHQSFDKMGQSFMSLPDTLEVIPTLEDEGDLERSIKCRLTGRIKDLQVTKEEFLLLTMVFFCDAGLADLSETGKALIETNKHHFTSALLAYCRQTYPQNGPTRFADLLSLFHVVTKTSEDMFIHQLLFSVKYPDLTYTNVFGQ